MNECIDIRMCVCVSALDEVTFIDPVRYSIENFIDFSIMSDLYGLSSGSRFEVNIIIPDVSLWTMFGH